MEPPRLPRSPMARSVTGRLTGDGSRGIVTTCYRLSVRDISMIERSPSHLYECSWRHYFRPRNVILLSPVYVCCLRVIMIGHEPSPLLVTPYGSGVLVMYDLVHENKVFSGDLASRHGTVLYPDSGVKRKGFRRGRKKISARA